MLYADDSGICKSGKPGTGLLTESEKDEPVHRRNALDENESAEYPDGH